MIDMHSHILPGLDDGAADWEQAIAMARIAVNDGIAEMVCTPHWVLGKYENGREAIQRQFAEFEARLAEKNIPLKIYAGAELRLDTTIPERLRTGELLTLDDGGRSILLELPDETLPENIPEFFWNLQMNNYQVILSHVERNPLIHENPQLLFTWVENGILAQVTAASLLADFSEEIREFSFSLVEHNLVHMLVTDTHSLRMRKPQLSAARKAIEEHLGAAAADRMVCDTPRHILRGEHVPVLDPIPFEKPRRRGFWSFFK